MPNDAQINIQVAQAVPTVKIMLADGRTLKWEMSLYTAMKMAQAGGDTFTFMETFQQRLKIDPFGSLGEVLEMGMIANHPELTRDEILRLMPPSVGLVEALIMALNEAMAAGAPEADDDDDPTQPGTAT